MNLPKWIAEAMISHAIEGLPNECCGILAGKNTEVSNLFRMKNVEESPFRYSMDGKEMLGGLNKLDDEGMDLLAIYHSHTHTPAYPSATDVRLATWPDAIYILISLMDKNHPVLCAFHIVDAQVVEEELVIS